MESLLKDLKKHVTCSICLTTFTEPKTTACLHTFCCECLKRHALKTQRQGQFRCPECQAQVDIPERCDQLPTGFLQNNLLTLLAVQQSGDGSEISCGNCRKKSAETSFCFDCGRFMCPDCVNAHELLRNVAFDGHKVRSTRYFQTEDYEAFLKRQSFCPQQYHEREVTRFFCLECQTCVCHVCVATDHRNHAVDSLDKVADHEKSKIMEGTEVMGEKRKLCSDVIRTIEQTILDLETNISTAQREVSQTAEQIIIKVREHEREAITTLENTRVSRTKVLNSLKTQVQSLAKQITQAMEFAETLVQRSSSSDILQSKKSLERRFEVLKETPVPSCPVYSFMKFVSTFEPENVTLGFIIGYETCIDGLGQDLQAGVEAELVLIPNVTCTEVQGKFLPYVGIEPAQRVGSLLVSEIEDGIFQVRFACMVPGRYNIHVNVKMGNLSRKSSNIFTGHFQVKERRLAVVGELNLNSDVKGEPRGIAVNSQGLIAVADCNGHILLFGKEGNYLRKFGRRGPNIGQLFAPNGITFLNDRELLVAEALNGRVQQFNVKAGKGVRAFGKKGRGVAKFQNPGDVCMDDEGRVVVADYSTERIEIFTKEGEPVFSFGTSGPTACTFHQNTFIVSDAENHCLKIFDSSGKFLRKIGEKGEGDGQLNWPMGLCVEKRGKNYNILVCDSNNGRIVQFAMDGSFTGKTIVNLSRPTGITATPDGKVLLSDSFAKKGLHPTIIYNLSVYLLFKRKL